MPAAPGLVIFDCDGVLVDSEAIANREFCAMLNRVGVAITLAETVDLLVGLSMPACIRLIEERFRVTLPATFAADLEARTFAAFDAGLAAFPGVAETLDRLAPPFCVASSGEPAKIRFSLGRTGLLPRFDGRLFSAAEVAHGKPAPDLFLLAAATLGVAPRDCLVIEDSRPGVAAGVAAGMTVFGFTAGGHVPPGALVAAGAALEFAHMADLIALIERP